MIKLNKIILTILLILIFISIFMYSCEYNDMGLFTTISEEDEADSGKNNIEELDVNSSEFFLELKEKQINKNLLNDINIRKAIFYAIDRERIVDELLGKYGGVLNSLFKEDSYYYNPSWSEYDYDLNKAKEFLSKAGYGIDNPLYITIGSISDSSAKQIIEGIIKEDLDKIGIKLWIFNKPCEEWYRDFVGKGDYELGIWSIYNFDGTNLNYNFSSEKIPPLATDENRNCENFYWYKNAEVDEILRKITDEGDSEKKKELFTDLQDILAQDAVILPLYSRLFSIAYNNKKIKSMDVSVKNNRIFLNIENWILSGEEQKNGEISEIIIGHEGEGCRLSNPFDLDYINNLVLKGLWEINENGEYEEVLVEGDSLSENDVTSVPDLKVRVLLKDEISWENGNPITSEDVKSTYDAILENYSIMGFDEDYSKVEGIEVINEREFNIVFKEKVKDWKKLFGIVLEAESLKEKDINDFSVKDIVANGPYKIEECVDGEYLLLKKNDSYFGEPSKIDSIKILFDTDINNLVSMLKDGEIDLLSIPVDLDLMKELEENENFSLLVKPGNLLEHLAISLKPKEE